MKIAGAFLAAFLDLLALQALAEPKGVPPDIDTRNGVPATQAGKLPKSEERYRSLQKQIEQARPSVETAKQKSEALATQAAALRQQLIGMASKVQGLEQAAQRIDAETGRLAQQEKTMAAQFAQDRRRVSRLLAVLERLQSDLPPAMALEPGDALRSARGAMLLGAALPRVYRAAVTLSHQLRALKQTRAALAAQRVESARNAVKLATAQGQLDKLLVEKEREASGADAQYAALQSKFDVIANQASDLKTLLDRVAVLRRGVVQPGMVVVGPQNAAHAGWLRPGTLSKPVTGRVLSNPPDERLPGISFLTASGAAVVAPADSHVLFAGAYHKTSQIVILEAAGGYDLVLVGLDRVDVRPGDQLLAGEPVGRMPHGKNGATLYFELRQGGKSINPALWLGTDLRKAKRS